MAKPSQIVLGAAAVLAATALAQNGGQKPALDDVASGRARVIDLSYAISDKMVPWPGDAKGFEARTNATVEKDGYFTRSFWMLEHFCLNIDPPPSSPPLPSTAHNRAGAIEPHPRREVRAPNA